MRKFYRAGKTKRPPTQIFESTSVLLNPHAAIVNSPQSETCLFSCQMRVQKERDVLWTTMSVFLLLILPWAWEGNEWAPRLEEKQVFLRRIFIWKVKFARLILDCSCLPPWMQLIFESVSPLSSNLSWHKDQPLQRCCNRYTFRGENGVLKDLVVTCEIYEILAQCQLVL